MPARKPQPKTPARRESAPRSAPPEQPHEEGIPFPLIPRDRRYRVLSGGISTPTGPAWNGAIITAEQLGDADRVTRLLGKGSIEEVTDD